VIVEFDQAFARSVEKIKDKRTVTRILKAVEKAENSPSLEDIPNIKKLSGFKNYFRVKVGDYRLGFEKIDSQTIRFILASHRKDIYRNFP